MNLSDFCQKEDGKMNKWMISFFVAFIFSVLSYVFPDLFSGIFLGILILGKEFYSEGFGLALIIFLFFFLLFLLFFSKRKIWKIIGILLIIYVILSDLLLFLNVPFV